MGTEIKMVNGFKGNVVDNIVIQKQIAVRFTSDKIGETISLEDGNVIIGVPFKDVEQLIEKARKSK